MLYIFKVCLKKVLLTWVSTYNTMIQQKNNTVGFQKKKFQNNNNDFLR